MRFHLITPCGNAMRLTPSNKLSSTPGLSLERFHKWCKRGSGSLRRRSVKRTPEHSPLSPRHSICDNALNEGLLYMTFSRSTAPTGTTRISRYLHRGSVAKIVCFALLLVFPRLSLPQTVSMPKADPHKLERKRMDV